MDAKVIREQAVRDAKATLILNASRKVFAEKGYFEARLEDIAEAAGFSKAALYTYYSDKEEIFLSLVVRDLENLVVKLKSIADPAKNVMVNIETMLSCIFNFFGENFAFLLSLTSFQSICESHQQKMTEKHAALFEVMHRNLHELTDHQVTLLHCARERGEITTDLDDEKLADFMGDLIRGMVFHWKVHGKMGDVVLEIRRVMKFIACGLGCTPVAENAG